MGKVAMAPHPGLFPPLRPDAFIWRSILVGLTLVLLLTTLLGQQILILATAFSIIVFCLIAPVPSTWPGLQPRFFERTVERSLGGESVTITASSGENASSGGPREKLLIEMTPRTSRQLTELAHKQRLNRSTVVNRAVQVYAFTDEVEERGDQLLIGSPQSGRINSLRFREPRIDDLPPEPSPHAAAH